MGDEDRCRRDDRGLVKKRRDRLRESVLLDRGRRVDVFMLVLVVAVLS